MKDPEGIGPPPGYVGRHTPRMATPPAAAQRPADGPEPADGHRHPHRPGNAGERPVRAHGGGIAAVVRLLATVWAVVKVSVVPRWVRRRELRARLAELNELMVFVRAYAPVVGDIGQNEAAAAIVRVSRQLAALDGPPTRAERIGRAAVSVVVLADAVVLLGTTHLPGPLVVLIAAAASSVTGVALVYAVLPLPRKDAS